MPLAAIVACSLVAAAFAGVATYVLLIRFAGATPRRLPVRLQTPSPFATAEVTRTDLITVPEPHVLDAEPSLELRLAWHIARRTHGRHHAT